MAAGAHTQPEVAKSAVQRLVAAGPTLAQVWEEEISVTENGSSPLLLALAVIGGIALILILGSWLFHASMMSGMMGGMMGGMSAGMWLLGLLAIAGIVAAAFL